MTSWFTENSTVPMVTGVILVIILLGLAFSARERAMVYLALVVGALTAGTMICERMVVTDQEEVMQCVYDLADAVQANDRAGVLAFVSKTQPETINKVNHEMPSYDFDSCRIVGRNYFVPGADGRETAEICFVVSYKVRVDGSPQTQWGHRKIILHFEKQPDGKWRVIDYSHEAPSSNLTI